MKFTFGIISDGSDAAIERLGVIIGAIEHEEIPDYEIIVVGNCDMPHRRNLRILPFDETKKRMWITRKKNLITEEARFDNIVYMHDYIKPEPGWYSGWVEFGIDYKACMNPIRTADGRRFRDWATSPDDEAQAIMRKAGGGGCYLLPYSETRMSKMMYFSGAYWVAKKDVMKEFPLDETRVWQQAEDIEWSARIRKKYDFSLNTNSTVSIYGKDKDPIFKKIPAEKLNNIIENYCK